MAAFQYHDFVLFLAGRVFCTIAIHMVTVAITFQVYDLTKDAMNLAYIGLATFAPAFGFALVTGYVADRFDRRLVIAVCYGVIMISAAMFWHWSTAGAQPIWLVFVIVAVLGTGRAFFQPASSALVPNLVPEDIFPNAVAWYTSATKSSQIVGPSLGGMLYLAGPEVVYATAAVTLAIAIVATVLIRTRTAHTGKQPTNLKTLLAGLKFVFEKKVILGATTLDLFAVPSGVQLRGNSRITPLLMPQLLVHPMSTSAYVELGVAGTSFQIDGHRPLTSAPLTESRTSKLFVVQRSSTLPRARLLFQTRPVDSENEARDLLRQNPHILAETIVLEGSRPGFKPRRPGIAPHLEWELDAANSVRLHVKMEQGRGYLLLADAMAPGWFVTVDGVNTPLLQANLAFRAVALSEGKHTVEFVYRPWITRFGLPLLAFGLILSAESGPILQVPDTCLDVPTVWRI